MYRRKNSSRNSSLGSKSYKAVSHNLLLDFRFDKYLHSLCEDGIPTLINEALRAEEGRSEVQRSTVDIISV